ncbi:hypothetical protein XM25_00635 [Devosia sp. H5989]|nr:hypothetical protein XM25_00635 [Devosia sp. H5989]
MQIPPVKREWNINTIISVCGFVGLLAGMVWTTAQRDADLSALAKDFARADQRITALEVTARRLDNLEYRVSTQEQGAQTLAKAVDDLKAALADQSADLRVIREIVTRLDPRPPIN